jgi:hypothetical protein
MPFLWKSIQNDRNDRDSVRSPQDARPGGPPTIPRWEDAALIFVIVILIWLAAGCQASGGVHCKWFPKECQDVNDRPV